MLFKVITATKNALPQYTSGTFCKCGWSTFNFLKLDCSSREKTQFCITVCHAPFARAPSHCSSQLQSGIVCNLTKNYSSQQRQGPRAPQWNPWNISLLLIYWAQARAGAGVWIACRAPVVSRHSRAALYYGNSYLTTLRLHSHTFTTVWLPFGPHFGHVYLKYKKKYFIAQCTFSEEKNAHCCHLHLRWLDLRRN